MTEKKPQETPRASWVVPPWPAFLTSFFSLLVGVFGAQVTWSKIEAFLLFSGFHPHSANASLETPACQGVLFSYQVLHSAMLALMGVFSLLLIALAFFLLYGRGWARLHTLLVWSMGFVSSFFVPAANRERVVGALVIAAFVYCPLGLKGVREFYEKQTIERSENTRSTAALTSLYGTFVFSFCFIFWNYFSLIGKSDSIQCLREYLPQAAFASASN